MSKLTIEVTHAIEEESGLMIALTEVGNLYVLGKEKSAKIATRLGEEWFEGSKETLETYKEKVIQNSSPKLVEKINDSLSYQNQLWAILQEETKLNDEEIESKENKRENKTTDPSPSLI